MSGRHYAALTGPDVTIRSGAATHVGRVRDHNEDSLIAEGRVYAVADGMGGHAAGEVASGIAVQCLGELNARDRVRSEDVVALLRHTNARILESAAAHPEQTGMGTTVAGLTVVDAGGADHWIVFNIGDSRVYRFLGNRMSLVTQDHSEVREMVDAGLITAEEALRHPMRNIITRSLGTNPGPNADVWVFPPHPGERFVLCSDGLTNELDDRTIMVALQKYDDPQVVADHLCQAAVEAGGRDNISVVVVAFDADDDDSDEADTAPRHTLIPT
ncbi:protein phosphatase [Knoellia sinensis KCTC 19936]|uniref:Protein phosphatase n=1 Tax=Knoellia sinensis KCTC 19936 TaxID=1385520 RepID=A0A0A0J243_9MICO|nr:protein phosphatase 2C domain-containing protein [Knoellia sinensis]KGN31173.1 protein phosphatase [Knoellia sinensis KCTC 19936]